MKHYKVVYLVNGEKRKFTFESDKSFRAHGTRQSAGVLDLGYPFTVDMATEGTKHEGFSWDKIVLIKCIETGEKKYY